MDRMVAYCGIVCTDCPGYIATQVGDLAELERLAEHSRQEYHRPEVTLDLVPQAKTVLDELHAAS